MYVSVILYSTSIITDKPITAILIGTGIDSTTARLNGYEYVIDNVTYTVATNKIIVIKCSENLFNQIILEEAGSDIKFKIDRKTGMAILLDEVID